MAHNELTVGRVESWKWETLDANGNVTGLLDGVRDARLDYSIFNTVRGSGSLDWAGVAPPSWMNLRLRPWYQAETAYGLLSWPLGVFIPAVPATGFDDTSLSQTVQLFDKLLLLDQDKVEQTYTLAAGTVATTALRALLAPYGAVSVSDSAETLSNPMSWPADTSILQIANELCKAINFFSIWADGYGTFRAEKYVAPLSRPIAYPFKDDFEEGIYDPAFSREQDTFDVPNKVTLITRVDGEALPLRSTVINADPLSPTSTVNRGTPSNPRVISRTENDVEATSQAILDEMVVRRLLELSSPSATMSIAHAMLNLNLNDAVGFVNDRWQIEKLAVIQTMSIQMEPGSLCQTKLLEVA